MITHQVRIVDLIRLDQSGKALMSPRCICGWSVPHTTGSAAERHKATHLEWAYRQAEAEGALL